MNCRHCGKEIGEKAVVCSGCGHPVDEPGHEEGSYGHPWHFIALLGLITAALFLPPVGLVFGIMGLMDPAKRVQAAVITTASVFMSFLYGAMLLGNLVGL